PRSPPPLSSLHVDRVLGYPLVPGTLPVRAGPGPGDQAAAVLHHDGGIPARSLPQDGGDLLHRTRLGLERRQTVLDPLVVDAGDLARVFRCGAADLEHSGEAQARRTAGAPRLTSPGRVAMNSPTSAMPATQRASSTTSTPPWRGSAISIVGSIALPAVLTAQGAGRGSRRRRGRKTAPGPLRAATSSGFEIWQR